MPWCDACSRFYSPNTVLPDGACPSCGRPVEGVTTTTDSRAPWHFWVLVVLAVIYLGWRLVQGIAWLIARL